MHQPCMLWRCIVWERRRIMVLFRSDRTREHPLEEGLVDRIVAEARRQFPECAEEPYVMTRVYEVARPQEFRLIQVNISQDGTAFSDFRQWTHVELSQLDS